MHAQIGYETACSVADLAAGTCCCVAGLVLLMLLAMSRRLPPLGQLAIQSLGSAYASLVQTQLRCLPSAPSQMAAPTGSRVLWIS